MIQQFHSWYILKKPKLQFKKIQAPQCSQQFTAALFMIAKIWKQPQRPSTDEWLKKRRVYTIEYCSAIKRMKICHLQQTLYDITYIWNQKIQQTSEYKDKEADIQI